MTDSIENEKFLDSNTTPQQKLRRLAEHLEKAPRIPPGKDIPEGSVSVVFSDTTVRLMILELRYAATQIDGTDK